jgi:hypothetical protein
MYSICKAYLSIPEDDSSENGYETGGTPSGTHSLQRPGRRAGSARSRNTFLNLSGRVFGDDNGEDRESR